MTANQIAYHANKIKEEEAAIRQRQYELDREIQTSKLNHQKMMDLSTHLHEYGEIRTPTEKAYVPTGAGNMGLRQQESSSKASKNYADVIKALFTAGISLLGDK